MTLVAIKPILDAARKRGFTVHGGHRQAEIWAPKNDGPRAVWYDGSQYSTADFVIDDYPSHGYGYNDAFVGPWHIGFTQSDAFGLRKLLSHPAMSGFASA